uniref:PP2C family protein-serine/threonine phosphatase n=1 Tax=Streptomyces sp. SBT349 TaxID=1580539 RepID=UPI00069E04EE
MSELSSEVAGMLASLLRVSHTVGMAAIPSLVAEHANRVGLADARIHVADIQERVLRELTSRGPDAAEGGAEVPIEATLPGRAYQLTQALTGSQDGRPRIWLPILDGTERLGVLSAEPSRDPAPCQEAMDALTSLVGLLLVSKRGASDSYSRLTRRRPMSVSAEMQWTLMPQKTFTNGQVMISAVMEPAYATAGDAFDYAQSDRVIHLAVFDSMGHDTAAGLAAALAVGTSRSHRRASAGLLDACESIDATLAEQFSGTRYVTGLVADLDQDTGHLTWVNRGHPPPVLIRGGQRSARTLCC